MGSGLEVNYIYVLNKHDEGEMGGGARIRGVGRNKYREIQGGGPPKLHRGVAPHPQATT